MNAGPRAVMSRRNAYTPTPRQLQVLAEIARHIAEHGKAPTRRQLAVALQIKSTNAIDSMLTALELKGFVTRERFVTAGIALLPAATEVLASRGAA